MKLARRTLDDRPEPVFTLIDLNAAHGMLSLIEGLAAIAEYEAEENACCIDFGR